MTRSGLLLGVAAVFAGTTVLMAVLGAVYNPVLLPAALPFAGAAYFIWSHATGRLGPRMRGRARTRPTGGGRGSRPDRTHRGRAARAERSRQEPDPADRHAARVLGVAPDADEAAVRRAYRERARDLHPDAPGGDEAAFRRVRDAYERLRRHR